MMETRVVGRNEPCPCHSGKKYKRCCGVSAAPKLTPPNPAKAGMPPLDPSQLGGMDPQMMLQFSQSLQRLPKGQLQRLQSLMQKAMSGKDVTAEAQDFEKSLPPDFQSLLQSFQMPTPDAMGDVPLLAESSEPMTSTGTSAMTEEQARNLVAQAAAEGAISKEQAELLLKAENSAENFETSEASKSSKLGQFWKNWGGKKTS